MEIAEGLAESAVATGTRQDVDVQVEDDRPIAGIAHRQGETLVVHQRQRVGYRSPSKQTRRSHLSIGERIGHFEVKRIAIGIRNGKVVLE